MTIFDVTFSLSSVVSDHHLLTFTIPATDDNDLQDKINQVKSDLQSDGETIVKTVIVSTKLV